jgi:hypothetical protein
MKNITLLTVFLFVFGFVGNAQKQTTTFSKDEMAKAMSLFVENVKPAYQKAQTYKEFEKALLGTWKNTPEGTALLTKAYEYISKGVSQNRILKEYSGQEIANALATSNKLKKVSSDGKELFGGTIKDSNSFSDKATASTCKWYNLGCYFNTVSVLNKSNKQ